MVDDVKDITETAESKVSTEALDRARVAREKRESEQRKRLEELRAHAAAAQAQREKRDEERRRRQAEQRARDDDRRTQVEERKRAIWEASVSRREALLQREREREERLERSRASRSSPRSAFAFGSSTPRLLEPVDTTGFFWAARSTNPLDQMNYFDSLASSTTNVMFASAPLTRRASALHLDSENDNKDEPDRQPAPVMWSSVARRRTDLVPTIPASRGPGRAYSMTRLDRIPAQRPLHSTSPSMHHLNRQSASGASTPSRPGSALSTATTATVTRRNAPRRPRPASIAGTGVNTPRGGGSTPGATSPAVSRDGSSTAMEAPRRPRRPRPVSAVITTRSASATTTPTAEGKPPLHRKPKLSKEQEKANRAKSMSVSPGRGISPSPNASKESSVDKEVGQKKQSTKVQDKSQLSATEVSMKLEALQIHNGGDAAHQQHVDIKVTENKEIIEDKNETNVVQSIVVDDSNRDDKQMEVIAQKQPEDRDKGEMDNEMTASMTARRITTEEEAKAALAERRRRAREELERLAELDRLRLEREAEEEAERQRQEEERQKREEEEAKELARLQRQMEEDKLMKAIEAQQQLEREAAERKAREELEKQARIKEEEEKRKALEEELKLKREEAEREEKERIARKQRVEAIMARTRLKKAEEDKKQEKDQSAQQNQSVEQNSASQDAVTNNNDKSKVVVNNGNATTGDLLGLDVSINNGESNPSQVEMSTENQSSDQSTEQSPNKQTNNGNVTADLLGLSEQHNSEDKIQEQTMTPNKTIQQIDNGPNINAPTLENNNGNVQHTTNVGHISANFIQTERIANEEDFTTHNGHGTTHTHPLTLQNAI